MEKVSLSCCFTGYRPQKMPFLIDDDNPQFKKFENMLVAKILELINAGCTTFYTGMAMGFDIIAAEAVLLAKEVTDTPVELYAVIPYKNQDKSFPYDWKSRYERIIKKCDKAILLCDSYNRTCFFLRNQFMVDNSDIVLTYFDGKSGGTKSTVDYAARKGRQVINLYNE